MEADPAPPAIKVRRLLWARGEFTMRRSPSVRHQSDWKWVIGTLKPGADAAIAESWYIPAFHSDIAVECDRQEIAATADLPPPPEDFA